MMIILCKVDLEYPNELHYLHNDYLLAPESLPITYDIWQIIVKKLQASME